MKLFRKSLFVLIILLTMIILSGCNNNGDAYQETEDTKEVNTITPATELKNAIPMETEANYEEYFNGKVGTAVFYLNKENKYYIYNKELAEKESSPCSSFKIISCLMGLESGIIHPDNSVLPWDGTIYPVAEWNQDIDYGQAFQSSCIWYFRTVIDSIGGDYVQNTLDKLDYGNCDISKWEGSLVNMIFPNMKDNLKVNGFWQEASLQISPREQVDVIRRIFEEKDVFSQDNLDLVKAVMKVKNTDSTVQIYGKTGSGIKDDNWNDAWFVGMFDKNSDTVYYAVRLNQTGMRGPDAKEIALNIIKNEFSD